MLTKLLNITIASHMNINHPNKVKRVRGIKCIFSLRMLNTLVPEHTLNVTYAGNTKGGSITVLLTSCLTGLD